MPKQRKVVRGRRIVTAGALAAGLLLLTSCSVLSGREELSQECEDLIVDAANEFRDAVEPLSGDRIVLDSSTVNLTFSGPEKLINDCDGENQNEVASVYVMEFSAVTNSFSSPFPQIIMANLCQGLLDDPTIGLTQEAYDTCNESVENADATISDFRDLLEGAESWVENGELPSSAGSGDSIFGPDGPAIGGVDTDLRPSYGGSSMSDSVAPYELVYVVDGVGQAVVTYMNADDVRITEEVTLPWQYSATSIWGYTVLEADQSGFGQLSCAIYHDGVEVDKFTISGDAPEVFCLASR